MFEKKVWKMLENKSLNNFKKGKKKKNSEKGPKKKSEKMSV